MGRKVKKRERKVAEVQKLTFLSSKLTFLSSELTFLSSRGHPFDTGCSPLSYSGNSGVHGVSHRGGEYV